MSTTECYIEFQAVGNTVKVTAIDPHSGVEATIVGPASAGQHILTQQAVKKLQFLLAKKE